MGAISSIKVDARSNVPEAITTLNFSQDLKEATAGKAAYSYEEIRAFNENFSKQVRALCSLWGSAVSVLEIYPKIDRDKFWSFLNKFIPETGLDGKYESFAHAFFDELMDRHEKVVDFYLEHHENPVEIFEGLFGSKPRGKVEVGIGPSLLFLRCHDSSDFGYIKGGKSLWTREGGLHDTDLIKLVDHTIGLKLVDVLEPSLAGLVIVENAMGRDAFDLNSVLVYAHEKTHVFFSLLRRLRSEGHIVDLDLETNENFRRMEEASTPSERGYYMRMYLECVRNRYMYHVADELLAYAVEGEEPAKILEFLTTRESEGGKYDYFAKLIGVDPEPMGNLGKVLLETFGEGYRKEISAALREVFIDDFKKEVQRGLDAFARLKRRGYSNIEAGAVLSVFPMYRWTNISARLVADLFLPREKFNLEPEIGQKVVALDSQGKLHGDYTFLRVEQSTNAAVCVPPVGSDPSEIELLPLDKSAFEDLNYPYKTAQAWFDVYTAAGGDLTVKNLLGEFLAKEGLISADEAWGALREFSKTNDQVRLVFNTYRRLQRDL